MRFKPTGGSIERIVGVSELRRRFGGILQNVATRGDRVIVLRHRQAIAALVPIDLYNALNRWQTEIADRTAGSLKSNRRPLSTKQDREEFQAGVSDTQRIDSERADDRGG